MFVINQSILIYKNREFSKIKNESNFKKKIAFFSWVIVAFFLAIGCNQISNPTDNTSPQTELKISAAASLTNAMKAIELLYIKENPDIKIIYNFASSGSLQRQIEQGAPGDVFITAAPKQMNVLSNKGLILKETRKDLLTNQMVLIVPRDNNKNIRDFKSLVGDESKKIAIGEPKSVPAGKYAKEVLTSLGIFKKIEPKLVYGKNVRQVLNYVATGNVDGGIVYRSDTKITDKVKIAAIAPKDSHSPIIYPIAVIKESKNIEAAKEFIEYTLSPQAETEFKKYGFALAK